MHKQRLVKLLHESTAGLEKLYQRKQAVIDAHQLANELNASIADKKIELQEEDSHYQTRLEEHKKVQATCKQKIDAVKQRLLVERQKQQAQLEEFMRLDTNASLMMEDERSQTIRIDAKLSSELAKFNRLNSLAVEHKLMHAEEAEMNIQLTMSKPLVTGMLEFLAIKSNQATGNAELTSKICEI